MIVSVPLRWMLFFDSPSYQERLKVPVVWPSKAARDCNANEVKSAEINEVYSLELISGMECRAPVTAGSSTALPKPKGLLPESASPLGVQSRSRRSFLGLMRLLGQTQDGWFRSNTVEHPLGHVCACMYFIGWFFWGGDPNVKHMREPVVGSACRGHHWKHENSTGLDWDGRIQGGDV